MEVQFQLYPILPALVGLIEKIWYFETPGKLPSDDLKLVVPNGRPLLLIPCKNTTISEMGGKHYISPEYKLALVGVCDISSIIDSQENAPTASIGVEFSPLGFYRFFEMPAFELMNNLTFLSDIFGKTILLLEEEIANTKTVCEKVNRVQLYLSSMLNAKEHDAIFTYCISQIEGAKGSIFVKQLEKLTGYSSRWLNSKFKEQLGISPKNFSSIIRFQHYYKIITGKTLKYRSERLHQNPYYDQSHFIKDFKRFTGMTPSRINHLENKFGKLFY